MFHQKGIVFFILARLAHWQHIFTLVRGLVNRIWLYHHACLFLNYFHRHSIEELTKNGKIDTLYPAALVICTTCCRARWDAEIEGNWIHSLDEETDPVESWTAHCATSTQKCFVDIAGEWAFKIVLSDAGLNPALRRRVCAFACVANLQSLATSSTSFRSICSWNGMNELGFWFVHLIAQYDIPVHHCYLQKLKSF